MSWARQFSILVFLTAISGYAIFLVSGSPLRKIPCDPARLEAWEVCWDTVRSEWDANVLWVDARSRKEFEKGHLPGAIWIPQESSDSILGDPTIMNRIGMAGIDGDKVVVYCATDACGSSKFVAGKIRSTGFHSEVYTLFGGWKAAKAQAQE